VLQKKLLVVRDSCSHLQNFGRIKNGNDPDDIKRKKQVCFFALFFSLGESKCVSERETESVMLCIYIKNYILFMFIWHMVITVVIRYTLVACHFNTNSTVKRIPTYFIYFVQKNLYTELRFCTQKSFILFSHTHFLFRSPFFALHFLFN